MAPAHGIDLVTSLLGAVGILALLVALIGGPLSLFRPLSPATRLLVYSCVGAALAVLVVGVGFFVISVRGIQVRDDVGLIGDAMIAFTVGSGLGAFCFVLRKWLAKGSDDRAA